MRSRRHRDDARPTRKHSLAADPASTFKPLRGSGCINACMSHRRRLAFGIAIVSQAVFLLGCGATNSKGRSTTDGDTEETGAVPQGGADSSTNAGAGSVESAGGTSSFARTSAESASGEGGVPEGSGGDDPSSGVHGGSGGSGGGRDLGAGGGVGGSASAGAESGVAGSIAGGGAESGGTTGAAGVSGTGGVSGSGGASAVAIQSGTWIGTTSQALPIEFDVDATGTTITRIRYGWSAAGCGASGTTTTKGTIKISGVSVASNGGFCPSSNFAGTFLDPTAASGSLDLSFSGGAACSCVGSVHLTWTANAP